MVQALEKNKFSAFVPYALLLLVTALVTVRVGGMFWLRDMETGDTIMGLREAVRIEADPLRLHLVWEPLHARWMAWIAFFVHDLHYTVLWDRYINILVSSTLIFFIARHFLGNFFGLLALLWFLATGDGFLQNYSKHIFYFTLPAFGAFFALRAHTPWRQAAVTLFALLAALFQRNEIIVLALVFGALCLLDQIWFTAKWKWRPTVRVATPFFAAFVFVAALSPLAAWVAVKTIYNNSWQAFERQSLAKHTHNMCQIHVFGLAQRNPAYAKVDPWPFESCGRVMMERFGKFNPTLSEMVQNNPMAVAEHVGWNITLLPQTFEALLVGQYKGYAPDFNEHPFSEQSSWIDWVPLIWLAIILLGSILIVGNRPRLHTIVFQNRVFWYYALGIVSVAAAVALTQVPRPALMPMVGFLMQLTALLAIREFLLKLMPRFMLFFNKPAAFLALAVGSLLAMPDHYKSNPQRHPPGGLMVYDKYALIEKHYDQDLSSQGAHIWVGSDQLPNIFYLYRQITDRNMPLHKQIDYASLPQDLDANALAQKAIEMGVNGFYLDDRWFEYFKPVWFAGIDNALKERGWRLIPGNNGNRMWIAP